jgi:hypothetical protein
MNGINNLFLGLRMKEMKEMKEINTIIICTAAMTLIVIISCFVH